jgi:hypothetical protein
MDYGIMSSEFDLLPDVFAAALGDRVDDDDSRWCVGEESAHSLEELAELCPKRFLLHLVAGTTLVHHLERNLLQVSRRKEGTGFHWKMESPKCLILSKFEDCLTKFSPIPMALGIFLLVIRDLKKPKMLTFDHKSGTRLLASVRDDSNSLGDSAMRNDGIVQLAMLLHFEQTTGPDQTMSSPDKKTQV